MESECVRLAHSPARSNASAQRSLTASGMPGGMKACVLMDMRGDDVFDHPRERPVPPPHLAGVDAKADVAAYVPTRCSWKSCGGSERGTDAQPWSRKHRPVQSALVASTVVVQKRAIAGA